MYDYAMGAAGGLGGGGLGAGTGTLGRSQLHDALSILDAPRQSAYNLFRGPFRFLSGEGSWQDALGMLPGLAGVGVGLATGNPLLGALTAGGTQALGGATGSDAFNASTPSDLVGRVGGDPDSLLQTLLAGVLTDPLTYAGGLHGGRAGARAGAGMDEASRWAKLEAGFPAGRETGEDALRYLEANGRPPPGWHTAGDDLFPHATIEQRPDLYHDFTNSGGGRVAPQGMAEYDQLMKELDAGIPWPTERPPTEIPGAGMSDDYAEAANRGEFELDDAWAGRGPTPATTPPAPANQVFPPGSPEAELLDKLLRQSGSGQPLDPAEVSRWLDAKRRLTRAEEDALFPPGTMLSSSTGLPVDRGFVDPRPVLGAPPRKPPLEEWMDKLQPPRRADWEYGLPPGPGRPPPRDPNLQNPLLRELIGLPPEGMPPMPGTAGPGIPFAGYRPGQTPGQMPPGLDQQHLEDLMRQFTPPPELPPAGQMPPVRAPMDVMTERSPIIGRYAGSSDFGPERADRLARILERADASNHGHMPHIRMGDMLQDQGFRDAFLKMMRGEAR